MVPRFSYHVSGPDPGGGGFSEFEHPLFIDGIIKEPMVAIATMVLFFSPYFPLVPWIPMHVSLTSVASIL